MIKLENVSKYYYSSSNVTCALRNINLEFKLGEFVAITGESGSGKTTLLNVISGLDSYEDGEMYYGDKQSSYFDDEDWEKYRKDEIAFIFQNYNLIDSFTVLENVLVAEIIDGIPMKEAKKKAKEILKQVGLEKEIHKKATKLSGGQKQRLAIARALAKNTNIIVADEPTGNLDAENGKSILKLLKELSKNKLVIIVTHNQSEVEPFITRKVRLHDGEIVLDETIEAVSENIVPTIKKYEEKHNFKKVFSFALFNVKAQPKRSFLLLLLMLITSLASFVFVANFKVNLDDNKTKVLDESLFKNFDDTRMLVRGFDDQIITEDILAEIKVPHVESIEPFDAITDVNYYRPSDYRMKYAGGAVENPVDGSVEYVDSSSLILTDHSHYMRSSYCLNEEMLAAGRLPSEKFEMVVYSSDLSVLDTEEMVLFRNDYVMGDDTWYKYNVKIVGILKDPTEQAYFSDDICKVLEVSRTDFSIRIVYYERVGYYNRPKYLKLSQIVIDPYLEGFDLSLDKVRLEAINRGFYTSEDNTYLGYSGFQEYKSFTINTEQPLGVSDYALGVSEEIFEYLYQSFKNKKQFALFVEDYAYISNVRGELANLGYESISCYQVSVAGYDNEKVLIRYINLIISALALIIVNALAIVIGHSILKVKKNDYVIFKMIGLSNKLCKKINYLEVLLYAVIPCITTTLIAVLVKNYIKNELIVNTFHYVRFYDYIIVFGIVLLAMLLLGRSFGKFIAKKAKITVLKED